ncbi:TonB-dependent receptor [Formosa sp. PL04]|uniref:SusC/RagA family TonB-linked outer membrane protein n=1 Tax=Formosa sp. PL04 TaxID=3081755 RepID=UPI002981A36F|nr:TonB-dependent receptor [Formosa sp. PL04]MDW5288087.1 TonB-dependent receptor [Formosa sp. PL04]
MKNKLLFKSNKVKWRFLFTVFVFLFTLSIQAQEITVEGTVTADDDGFPIPGVTVLVKGTQTGTITDFDGIYTIKANIGDVLMFSFLGMNERSIKIEKSQINVSMSTNTEMLDEIVVIGYGTVTKKELTGAVSQVKSETIEEYVGADMNQALQGQVAGVSVTSSGGDPGGDSSITIRGITSLGGSNTPLFVVDGIPQQGDPRLSPNEIETVDILKDAASAAVYGTRGAAGVILITTKRGKAGKTIVSVDGSFGVQTLGDNVALMNTQDKIFYELNVYNYTDNDYDPGPWQNPEWLNNDNKFTDYVLNDSALTQQYGLNVSGGTGNFSYSAVGGYFSQEGALINSGFKKYNARITTTYSEKKWQINTSVAFNISDIERASNGLIVSALRYPSYYPLVDPSEDVVYTNGNGGVTTPLNALATSLKRKDNSNADKINASLSAKYNFTDAFSFTTRMGTAVTNEVRSIFIPSYTVIDVTDNTSEIDPTKSSVEEYSARYTTFSWDGSLDYKKKFGDHKIGATGSVSIDENSRREFTGYKEGVANSSIEVLNGATINPNAYSGFNYTTKILGFLGRVQYDYKGKYLFSALVRQDGSSKFGQDYRWGTFPSFSAAWNISDENFWKNIEPVVNNFKLRLSHGTVGNESFPAYEYSSSIVQGTDYIFDENDTSVTYGTAIKSYANTDVKWETSVQNNIGFDMSFLQNHIYLTADFYRTEKNDMLFPVELPGSTGAYYDPSITLNVGDMVNTGIEIAASYQGNIGESQLNVGMTFTKNDNEITKMAGDTDLIYNSNSTLISGDAGSAVTVLSLGHEASSFWLYETDGVITSQDELNVYKQFPSRINAQLGDLKYIDYDGDGDITEADKHYMGSALPDFEMGLNLSWKYKNFDFTMNWYATVGSEIMNGTKAAAYNYGNHEDLVNMWTPNNPTSGIPLQTGDSKSGKFNYLGSTDYWLENGDFLRLKLISLGYTIPSEVLEKSGISKLRIYVNAQNPITITNYDGYDPEIGGESISRRGVDVSRYPLSSLYTLGLKFNF